MFQMTRAELLAIFDEITGILEAGGSAVEKLDRIESIMFEPAELADESEETYDDD